MEVRLGTYSVPVEIIYKDNKNLYIRIKEDLVMYVSCHKGTSAREIEKVISQNEKSLLKMYEKALHKKDIHSIHYYLGNPITVIYDESLKKYSFDGETLFVKDDKMLDKFYRDACERVFPQRVDRIKVMFDGIPEFKLRIRFMTTRWGVNNRTDNIVTLNSELIKRDVSLLDYVIVHELSHFYEGNHSARFWAQVEKRYPYYKEARKALNES